jgi:competence protein ComEC
MKSLLVSFLLCCGISHAARNMDTYVIDVEGGKSVLVVAPSGESMLFDLGWPGYNGRDSDRITKAAHAAGLKQIDYLVVSHYDLDHMGDVPLLIAKIPVKHIVDHGDLQTSGKGVEQRYKTYAEARDRLPHTAVKPGDRIPVKGINVLVVTSAAQYLQTPQKGAGAPNSLCSTITAKPELPQDKEDNMSVGLLFTYGKFRMLDLADFEWAYDHKLMCPNNPFGSVDVYMVSIHGQDKGVSPVLAQALNARVAVMGNGAGKGGAPQTWDTLKGAPGLQDIWQSHYSIAAGANRNPPADFIANPDAANDEAFWIRLSARSDGSFTVTNARNGFSKTYPRR